MATTTTRPLSLQPSWYGIDLSRRSTDLRPLSLAFSSEPRRRRQSSSTSGQAHHSATMGFNLKGKVRRSSPSRPQTPEMTNQGSHVLTENVNDQGSPKRTDRFLSSSSSLRGVKKKRSITSFFPNGDASSVGMALGMVSTPFITTINDRPASTPPTEKKRVSVVLEVADIDGQNDEDGADEFQQKNHFLTKQGMKHHPYPHEAPYMQAYDPILLDK
jgi:hypothetical protein